MGRNGAGRFLDFFRPKGTASSGTLQLMERVEGELSSFPEDHNLLSSTFSSFINLPNNTPFFMLKVYRFLRDAIPDISDAVWTWKRLCQTGYEVEILDASSELARDRAYRMIRDLDTRVNADGGGMDGLLDIFYTSLFTYGAAALEIVLSRSRESIHDIVPVDVWTVRFKRDSNTGKALPYQVHDGEEIPIKPELFFYLGTDRDGTNPYGRSMLRSIPFVVKIQQRLLEDMAKATRNAGWSKLHVKYKPGERFRGESQDDYQSRVSGNFEKLRDSVSKLKTDQNLVTYDNVEVDVITGNQRSSVFYENHKAVEEQVITGMHLMPILLGRNYGTTETYGTAQYEIINRQVASVNRAVKRLVERLYNFELSFMWGSARAKVKMKTNRTVDLLRDSMAAKNEIENAVRLRDEGFLDQKGAAARLGIDNPAVKDADLVGSKARPEGRSLHIDSTRAPHNRIPRFPIPRWSEVDKARLPREAFAYAPTEERQTWKLPHHFLHEGKMYVHRGGVIAAWAALNGAHTGRPMDVPSYVRSHLLAARRALGLEQRRGAAEITMEVR
jgi:hypothetical protein